MGVAALLGLPPRESKLPPLSEKDLKTALSYNLREEHLLKLYHKFLEVDCDCNGVWTVAELYEIILEPRQSMRAPIIDAVFFMGDSFGQGSITFQDFLVTFASFCALSKEEMLQLLFIIVDRDRNGRIDKQELLDYFSYVPAGDDGKKKNPIFPVNNKNALDKFRGGKWQSLAFDGLSQLVELFPYIVYPAYHTQELYRHQLLGKAFWDRLDSDRMRAAVGVNKSRVVQVSGRPKMEVKLPGRCSMLELLEYSRRKTAVQHGKRVVKTVRAGEMERNVSSVTKERDEEISRCPLLSMIRNPHCMYYVPYVPTQDVTKSLREAATRPEFELPDFQLETDEQGGITAGKSSDQLALGPGYESYPPFGVPGLDGDSSEGSSGVEEDSDDEQEDAEAAMRALQEEQRRDLALGDADSQAVTLLPK